jgi:hypothetical protein
MKLDPYIPVIQALAGVGLVGERNLPDELIVSAQATPASPDQGTRFVLSNREGIWYLSTWSPVRYRVPAKQDVVQLCSACMAAGASALDRLPPAIVTQFELQEIDDREYEELFPTEGEGD